MGGAPEMGPGDTVHVNNAADKLWGCLESTTETNCVVKEPLEPGRRQLQKSRQRSPSNESAKRLLLHQSEGHHWGASGFAIGVLTQPSLSPGNCLAGTQCSGSGVPRERPRTPGLPSFVRSGTVGPHRRSGGAGIYRIPATPLPGGSYQALFLSIH